MRQVILDTETTGLEPVSEHRIIELGCVEMRDRLKTGRVLHYYINPERDVEQGARDVHGITTEQLQGEPVFADIVNPFIEFVRDSEVIMHNAPFDVGFIDAELARLGDGWGRLEDYCNKVTDTLTMAREMHPGQKNSLDALCQRYNVDNSGRDMHGALLDAELLLQIYLALTGGQSDLMLDAHEEQDAGSGRSRERPTRRRGALQLKVVEPTPEELAAHQRLLERINTGG